MSNIGFFDTITEQSKAKINIVTKYFDAWARIMMAAGNTRIAYIDLFCGPGRYDDGTESTPLKIIRQAIKNKKIAKRLVTFFVDKNPNSVQTLEREILSLQDVQTLNHKPIFEIGRTDTEIVRTFEKTALYPTLSFLDPWGYKGISVRLIKSVIKDWGCDSIFLFNYNRINAALNNPVVRALIDDLFGRDRANQLRSEIKGLAPEDREALIMDSFQSAINDVRDQLLLTFRFEFQKRKRTSHFLVFVTKHVLGYTVMKSIMSLESKLDEEGIPLFEHPSTSPKQHSLFTKRYTLDGLAEQLLLVFAGQTLSMKEIYLQHNVGTPYIEKNYKTVLKVLEKQGKIEATSPMKRRPKNTFGDDVQVRFSK